MLHVLEKFKFCPACGSRHFDEQDEKSKCCRSCGFEYYLNPSASVAAFILNERGELLVTRRKREPGRGTLDLPGGFCDIGESIDEALRREVKEETALEVTKAEFVCSLPNKYRYSGFEVPTLDIFFVCEVSNHTEFAVADDVDEAMWLRLEDIHTEEFGLRSVRQALFGFLKERLNN